MDSTSKPISPTTVQLVIINVSVAQPLHITASNAVLDTIYTHQATYVPRNVPITTTTTLSSLPTTMSVRNALKDARLARVQD